MSRLFRSEAVEAHQNRLLGEVFIALPPTFFRLTTLLVVLVTGCLVFLSVGSYARKESVAGILSPDLGLARIHPPRSGVVGDVLIEEGQSVKAGEPLFTLVAERTDRAGQSLNDQMLGALDEQLQEIEFQLELEHVRSNAQKDQLAAEITGMRSEREAIRQQIRTQEQLLRTLGDNLESLSGIVDAGYISRIDFIQREENLLRNREIAADLAQRMASINGRIAKAELRLEHLPVESQERLSRLASRRAELTFRRIDLSGQTEITMTAPIDGRVAALQAIPGSSVDPRASLLNILPDNGELEALLYVPTRAIGFVEIGQEVRLLYDAFDYRQFGVNLGVVEEISASAIMPVDTQPSIQHGEPVYRVTVRLNGQTVTAYGEEHPLQAGMLLSADIVLNKRSILSWLFDPLLSLRGRT
jgi:membrane fusion protein